MSEPPPEDGTPQRPRPLQFRLRTLMAVTALVAALFSTLNWLGLPPQARMIILAVLGVGALAAVGLLVAVAGLSHREEGDDGRSAEADEDRRRPWHGPRERR